MSESIVAMQSRILFHRSLLVVPLMLIVSLTAACQTGVPPDALKLSRESLEQRQLQTRAFDTPDETLLLQASAGVLQDLGFTLDESETELGVIVASKDRSAVEAGQIAMALLFGVYTPIDKNQKIRASLVTRPLAPERSAVRVTFQRMVWNDQGQISKAEFVDDVSIYQEFFDKLGQSVFLTGHSI
jgi:hypothetical protein